MWVWQWMDVSLSMRQCSDLVTCPGCKPAFNQTQLGWTPPRPRLQKKWEYKMGRSRCDSSSAAFHNTCIIQDQINCIWVIWRTFKVFVLSLLGICRNTKITYKYEWGTVQLIAQSLSFIQFVPFPLLYCSPTLMSDGWDPSCFPPQPAREITER